MIKEYIKARWKAAALLLVFALIFALVFSLYELEAEAVLYASLLCAAAGLAALAADFYAYRRRCRAVELMRRTVCVSLNGLPEPAAPLEERYRALVETLYDERNRIEAASEEERRNAADYYAMWAHQVKTPIAAMRLLLQQPGEVDRQAVSAELFRIEQYVGMVLGYLKLEGDTSDFVLRRRELDPIVRGAVRKFAPLFIMKKITVDFPGTGITVLTDDKWLSFVIEQLLSNALKYTNRGEVAIRAEDGALVISDTGIGIAAEDLPRLGERGFTGYNGRADTKSTGLGLYLCRRVCDKLGHSLEISSEPGKGTSVAIGFGRDGGLYE